MNIAISDMLLNVPADQSVFQLLKDIDVQAVEVRADIDGSLPRMILEDGSTPFSIRTPAETRVFKERLQTEGVGVVALLLGTDFSSDDPDAQISWAKRAVEAAQELGAPVVRIDTATRNKELSVAQVRDNFVRCIKQVLQDTVSTEVDLGIENHGHLSNDPQFLDEVFAAVNDHRLGMTLDVGNFYWYGHPLSELYPILERFAPRAKHTHIKNINYPQEIVETRRAVGYEYGQYSAPLDEGNIDMKRVVEILRNAGYNRSLCIEDESLSKVALEERPVIMRRNVQSLRAALSSTQ